MSKDMDYIKSELESDSRLDVELDRGILWVDSDEWAEVPASGVKPSNVQVSKVEFGYDVRPVDSGGERFELSADEAVSVVKGFLKGEQMY